MDKKVYEFISAKTNDPIVEWRTCKRTGKLFPIFQGDSDMLQKLVPSIGNTIYDLPLPTLSPEAREQRRMMFKNERFLYKDICEHTNTPIISRFTDKHVFSNEAWHSDDWTQSQAEYTPDRSFHETMRELINTTIFQNLIGSPQNVVYNARYTNHASKQSNTYLMFNARDDEYCGYGYFVNHSKYIFDSNNIAKSEYCYECSTGDALFACFFCNNCANCSHLSFCSHMSNCQYCHFCTGLSNQSYCIDNVSVGKAAYEDYMKSFDLGDATKLATYMQHYDEIRKQGIVPAIINTNADHVLGNECGNSHNCFVSFELQSCQDIRYTTTCFESQDLMDITSFGESSHKMYEGSSVGKNSSNLCYCNMVGESHDLLYCIESKYCRHCFGCVNLYQKEYCIFNKQYTKEEYEKIVPQIIEKMKADGERGEFFDPRLAYFPYNDTLAIDYYPPKYIIHSDGHQELYNEHGEGTITLTNHQDISDGVLERGGDIKIPIRRRYKHEEINISNNISLLSGQSIPQHIQEVSDDILQQAIVCEVSGRPFRIIPIELDFYRKHRISLPRLHPDIRYERRLARNPGKKLFLSRCTQCQEEMLSVYPSDYQGKVYCKACYNKEIYG